MITANNPPSKILLKNELENNDKHNRPIIPKNQ
jgi:hypothetical protein